MDKIGIVGIAFFALLALWIVLKSVVIPLCGEHMLQKIVNFIGRIITGVLFGILVAFLIIALHFFGLGFIELMKSFGLEKLVKR